MTICKTSKNGEITILFDSRWQFPEMLGYKPTDPEYAELQMLWERVTGETIHDDTTVDEETEAPQPEN